MNRQPILDSWASGELFGKSEQFARGGIELSGISGWFALASAAQILPHGDRPRHATSHLADATDQLSRRPDGLAGLTDESAGLTGHPAGPPGELAGRPGRLSRRPGESDGPGAARREGRHGPRRPGAARRGGMDASGRGLDGPREHGSCALARAVFVPEGRRGVATGEARASRAEPVGRMSPARVCPGGAEGSNHRVMMPNSSAPAGAGWIQRTLSTGCVGETPTPPVATALDPSGVERHGHARRVFDAARAIGARGGAGGVHVRRGEVPEAHTAARPCGHNGAGGSGVRRG